MVDGVEIDRFLQRSADKQQSSDVRSKCRLIRSASWRSSEFHADPLKEETRRNSSEKTLTSTLNA